MARTPPSWHYRLRAQAPRLSLGVTVSWCGRATKGTLRDLVLSFDFELTNPATWQVHAPGNPLRPGVAADLLGEPVEIATAAGLKGSPGLVGLHQPAPEPRCLLLWLLSTTEIGTATLASTPQGVTLTLNTELAGRIAHGETLTWDAVHVEATPASWVEMRGEIPGWFGRLGIEPVTDPPSWLQATSIYEAHIGAAPFADGWRYEPYPEMPHLLDDLDRIADLGFTAIQLMPRHPYPSYNVHDYADIATSYGPEGQLRRLVQECHSRGMKVILDILLHGWPPHR